MATIKSRVRKPRQRKPKVTPIDPETLRVKLDNLRIERAMQVRDLRTLLLSKEEVDRTRAKVEFRIKFREVRCLIVRAIRYGLPEDWESEWTEARLLLEIDYAVLLSVVCGPIKQKDERRLQRLARLGHSKYYKARTP